MSKKRFWETRAPEELWFNALSVKGLKMVVHGCTFYFIFYHIYSKHQLISIFHIIRYFRICTIQLKGQKFLKLDLRIFGQKDFFEKNFLHYTWSNFGLLNTIKRNSSWEISKSFSFQKTFFGWPFISFNQSVIQSVKPAYSFLVSGEPKKGFIWYFQYCQDCLG